MALGKISADCVAPLGSMQLRREVLRYCGAKSVRARVVFRAMLCSGSFFLSLSLATPQGTDPSKC